jgi:hypothetical protein
MPKQRTIPHHFTITVTCKEFLTLPLSIRRKALKAQAGVFLIRKALDTLALALTKHNHVWTDHERALYEQACPAK